MLVGQVTTGSSVSFTRTCHSQLPVLPGCGAKSQSAGTSSPSESQKTLHATAFWPFVIWHCSHGESLATKNTECVCVRPASSTNWYVAAAAPSVMSGPSIAP